ncbi:MAG: amidohydrolase family protein [Kiritimatiellia bacterium]
MRPYILFPMMAIAVLGLAANTGHGANTGGDICTIFTNGIIYVDADSTVTNIAACVGVVVAHNVNPSDYAGARFVDLAGGIAYPGFNDSHNHLMEIGSLPAIMVNLANCGNAAEIAARVADYARFIPGSDPVIGSGFSLPALSNTWSLSDLALLDGASGRHEVMLLDNLGHNCIVNSMVISNCAITATSTVALSGIIDQENGRVTGLLRESAQLLAVPYIMDKVSDEDVIAGSLNWLNYWSSFGYTSIDDMLGGAGGRIFRPHLFRDLERQGLLPLRVNYAYTIYSLPDVDAATNYAGLDTDMVRFLGVKIFVDGAFGAGQAWTTWPHLQGSSNGVFSVYTNDDYGAAFNLNRIVERVDDLRLNMHYHVQGDAAIDAVLNAMDAVIARKGSLGSVHTIIHVAFPRPDQISRMRGFGSNLVATVQPAFWSAEENAVFYYGDRFTNSYPIMDLVDGGITVGMSTDFYVSPLAMSPPQVVMSIGMSPAQYHPPTRTPITMNALIRGFTSGSAATTATNDTGTLAAGKKADMVVYNRDLYSVTPQELTNGTVRVLSTWVGGSIKYNPSSPKSACGDVDGDGLSDLISVTGSRWYAWLSSSVYDHCAGGLDFGLAGTPLAGDFDNDGLADLICVSGSKWYIRFSSAQYSTLYGPYEMGIAGSTPVAGDIDGDRLPDIISVLGSSWYFRPSTASYAILLGPYDRMAAGVPVTGDIDGDKLDDLFIVAGMDWYVWLSSLNYSTLSGPYEPGVRGSTPLTGDIDGDGLADLISVLGSDWYVRFSSSAYSKLFGPFTKNTP